MQVTFKVPNRLYEAIILFHPDVVEKDQKAFFEKQKGILKSFEGNLNHVDCWGKRKLANPIKNIKLATYFHTTFDAQPEAVAELERTMRISDQVLRFMHSKLDDRRSLSQHIEDYREVQKKSLERDNEREKAFQRKQQIRKKPNGQ